MNGRAKFLYDSIRVEAEKRESEVFLTGFYETLKNTEEALQEVERQERLLSIKERDKALKQDIVKAEKLIFLNMRNALNVIKKTYYN